MFWITTTNTGYFQDTDLFNSLRQWTRGTGTLMMVFFFRVPACCSRSCTVTQRIFKNCTFYLKSIGVTYTRFIFYNLREDCTPLMPHQLSAASGSPCCMLLLKPQRTGCFPWNSCQLPWQLESLSVVCYWTEIFNGRFHVSIWEKYSWLPFGTPGYKKHVTSLLKSILTSTKALPSFLL